MEIIVRGRRQGKTLKLVKMCHERGGYIVCLSRSEVNYVKNMAQIHGYNIPMTITFAEFLNRDYYGKGCQKFYIDNADILLQRMTEVEIAAITMTKETEDDYS